MDSSGYNKLDELKESNDSFLSRLLGSDNIVCPVVIEGF